MCLSILQKAWVYLALRPRRQLPPCLQLNKWCAYSTFITMPSPAPSYWLHTWFEVTYAVKKAEWEMAWERSYMSHNTYSTIILLFLNCHPPLQLSHTQPSHPLHHNHHTVIHPYTLYLMVESYDPVMMTLSSYCRHSTGPVWRCNSVTFRDLRSQICSEWRVKVCHNTNDYNIQVNFIMSWQCDVT